MWQLVKKVIFSVILGLILLNSQTNCLDWKFAVTTATDIRFFYSNWTYTNHRIRSDSLLRGVSVLAYDGISDTLYYADNNVSLKQGQIYELKDFDYEGHPPPKLVITVNYTITGIVFDSLKENLYWSNGNKIMRHNVISNQTDVFMEEEGKLPMDITLDICERHMYYINQHDRYSTSIEQINLDNPKLVQPIVVGLSTTRSITVDYYSNKLYWLDNMGSTNVRIEEANFDGDERRVVFKQSAANPLHLTTDLNNIYYSSVSHNSVIRVGKHDGIATKIDYDFDSARPVDILMKHTVFELEHYKCKDVLDKMAKKIKKTEVSHQERPKCKNNGILNEETGKCLCQSLFIQGDFCETDLCYNFCLNNGKCSMNIDRSMKCDCPSSFSGNRCETDKCYKFCLNGGICSINKAGEPACLCEQNKYSGDRCELILVARNYTESSTEMIQSLDNQHYENYCLNDGIVELKNQEPSCKCPEGVKGDRCEINITFNEIYQKSCNGDIKMAGLFEIDLDVCKKFEIQPNKDCSCMSSSIFVVTFGVVVSLVLMLVIVIVIRKVYKPLRPKVKKTYVVRKNFTPLTSRPGGGTTEQCEITIEDCCNMNICETPCFDPKILQGCDSSKESKKNEVKRKEDKRKLLDVDFSNSGELY